MAVEHFHIERLSYSILVISLMLMTWAYLAGAAPSTENESRYPPCPFNPLCRCSNAGPDLGVVVCEDIPMADIPKSINMTKIHTFRMKRNELRQLEANRFHGTGVYKVSICQNYMTDIPEDAWNGLQRSLWELNLQFNLLQKIPQKSLKDLQKLKVLDLTGNEITEVFREDFRGVEGTLQSLVLAENSLTSVQQDIFRDLQRLEKLDLRGNNILSVADLAFQNGPQSLQHLNLADNLLNKIPFTPLSQLKNLHTVNLARNKIHETFDVFFQGQLSLDTLILDYNNIDKLIGFSFQNFGTLNRTSLQGNPIKTVDDDAFKEAKIKDISLRDCYIGQLAPKAFRGLETSLQKLDIGFNNLSILPEKMFDNFDYLKTLSFNDNELSFNPEDSFNGFRYTLQSLNLVGHRMGNVPIKELNNMRNLRSIGLSTLPDDSLSKEDFEGFGPALDSLYLPRNNIKSIQANAFQHIPGLKSLDLSENRIASVDDEAFRDVGNSLLSLKFTDGLAMTAIPTKPFKSLVTLKELDLSNNRLSSLYEDIFHSMRDLEELKLHDNKLDVLQRHLFESDMTPNLGLITLSFNHLRLIETQTFSDFEKLQKLFLDDNQITRIDRNAFQNLEGLELLNLEGNKINHIAHEAFQNLPKLEELNLAYNELKNFDIDSLDQVGTLATLHIDVSHNHIVKLSTNGSSWSSNSNVKILDFRYNNISKIAENYFDPIRSSLTHLYFGFNHLVNITKNIVKDMPHLQWLDFSYNKIERVDPESLRNTKKLQYFDISNNNLDDLASDTFADHPCLRIINLSGNRIKVIPENLLKDTVAEFFDASHNSIVKFPDQTLNRVAGTLKHLDMASNDITTLSASMFDKLSSLVYLDLSENDFKTVADSTFNGLASLTSLDLSHNPLGSFQYKALGGLQDTLRNLSLANTSLTSLPELYLSNLHYFNISGNKIAFLPPTAVANYTSLRLLDISNCELPTAANNAWHTIPRLRRLFLQGNRIKSIVNDTFLGLDRLEEINLHDLPLQSFQYGALMLFSSLRTLHISSYRDIGGFSFGNLIQHNHALRYIDIEVEDGTFDSELHGHIPQKLNNVTITGTALKSFGKSPFKDITSRWLRIDITNTSLDKIDRKTFEQLGAARWLELDVTGNNFKQIGEPSTTIYPGTPYSVFLTELKMSDNEWNCDCGIGWVEYWMKKWRQYVCTDDRYANFEDCWRSIRDLRDSQCRNKGNSSFVEVLKTDLECGWSSSGHLVPNYSHVFATLILGVFVMRLL